MKTQHTKGEWAVTPNGEWVGTLGKGKAPICKITNAFLEPTEAKANAKLIAAAPDMLEALLLIKSRLNTLIISEEIGEQSSLYKMLYGNNELNTAIEKATKLN